MVEEAIILAVELSSDDILVDQTHAIPAVGEFKTAETIGGFGKVWLQDE